jgi:hypothetical protein
MRVSLGFVVVMGGADLFLGLMVTATPQVKRLQELNEGVNQHRHDGCSSSATSGRAYGGSRTMPTKDNFSAFA